MYIENIGIRGSNAKYETGMKELMTNMCMFNIAHVFNVVCLRLTLVAKPVRVNTAHVFNIVFTCH